MATITLQEYADIKHSSIKDVVDYAKEKGLELDSSPEIILDDSILKQLDPVLHFRMKYNTTKKAKACNIQRGTAVLHQEIPEYVRQNQGKTFVGIIVDVQPDCAKIEFDGHIGILKLNNVTWGYISTITDFFEIGDPIDVMILGMCDSEIELGRKQLFDDPLIGFANKNEHGKQIQGVIKDITETNIAYIEFDKDVCGECTLDGSLELAKGNHVVCNIVEVNLEMHKLCVNIINILQNEQEQETKKDRKPKTPKRVIGIVKFFDYSKDFGFVSSGSKGISGKTEDLNKIFDFYINSSEWKSNSYPIDGEWIVFTPNKGKRGRSVVNAERLSYDKTGLLAAMQYRGIYAKFEGKDSKGDLLNHNVLCHIISKILNNTTGGSQIVIETFAEYLSTWSSDKLSNIIAQFLSDIELCKLLIRILPAIKSYEGSSELYSNTIKVFSNAIEQSIFAKKDIAIFNALPKGFNYIEFADKVTEILEASINTNAQDVFKWLKCHSEFVDNLTAKSVRLSNELLYLIYDITKDIEIFNSIDKTWSELYLWIKEKSASNASDFLNSYFANREDSFIEQCNIGASIDAIDLKNTVLTFLNDAQRYSSFLKAAVAPFAKSDLDVIDLYLSSNIDISHVYSELGTYLSSAVVDDEAEVRNFLLSDDNRKNIINDIISSVQSISDELYLELFAIYGDLDYINAVNNFEEIPVWINQQEPEFVCRFLMSCQIAFTSEEDKEAISDTIRELIPEKFKDAIVNLTYDEQYKIIQLCPAHYAREIVSRYFAATKLFDIFIGEEWTKLKSTIPYVSFDLESNGDEIMEFAFKSKDNIKSYEGENQLNSLIRALHRTEIIVGHRIKQWDLGHVLSKKGFTSNAFIWDTLEIEILLNPCRYSYALHTTHSAKDDTELVDKLFWNQLYRLSLDNELCKELSELLPQKINKILDELRQPIFAGFFKQSSDTKGNFYQELIDTDEKIISRLNEINAVNEKALIIAPKRLWPRISEYVNLSFIKKQEGIDFLSISESRLQAKPLADVFLNAILKRFVAISKTPIVANISQYLRINYLHDDILANYVDRTNGHIDCSDMSIITDKDTISDYKSIFFIGCEIENRLNQYTLPTLFSASDFWKDQNSIPMRLGASSYIAVSQNERCLPMFNDIPQDAANIWIERTLKGKYSVSYNYDFYKILRTIETEIGNKQSVETIKWTTGNSDNKSIVLVHSEHSRGFDYISKRVAVTSRYRATYWNYQFALIRRIHETRDKRPIILFIDDSLETSKVEQYARKCGFYIPSEGTLIRKLELIEHNINGLLVVRKDQFFSIVDWRKDAPYCYVWDNFGVEKHMMMWHGFTNEQNKSFLNDGIEEPDHEFNVGSTRDTYQSALLSIWPIYEYYFRFIKANSADSSMYILDSFLEEYHSLSLLWGTSSYGIPELWNSEDSYKNSLDESRSIFNDEEPIYQSDSDINTAMDIILNTLIKSENVPNPEWTPIQKEILPQILAKTSNFLVSLPTGGGKSVLFQGPALYNATYNNKLSIVVTPLKALMQDQVKELSEKGFITNVDYLNGDRSFQEVRSIYRKINGGEIAILYVTPERFRSRAFLNALTTRMANDHGLEYMIFDEAHCISQWGMEFRPEYLNVIQKCRELQHVYGNNLCIAMFSATVTDMIYNQINDVVPVKRLGQDNDKHIYNPVRNHIGMEFKEVVHDMPYRLNEIVKYIVEHEIDPRKSRMLVFCKTRNQCEELSLMLKDALVNAGVLETNNANDSVGYFHAGMDGDDREDIYVRFKDDNDPLYILCATKAFGMGMDIPNIHYIVHLMPPSVMEDYLQEVGRAGRNKTMYESVGFSEDNPIPALCLCSKDDVKKAKEQLLQSSLSWKNLEEIRVAVNTYIQRIQSIEKAKEYPIVIPNTLWANGQFDYEFTDFKLGLYWLERMNRIKMGYLSPTHITITLLCDQNTDASSAFIWKDKLKHLSNSINAQQASAILNELEFLRIDQHSDTIQVSLQKLASHLCMHSTKLLDSLIWCEKIKILRIEEESRCRIAFTRLSEVAYMLKPGSHDVALHVVLNATRELLRQNGLKVEKNYTIADIRKIIKDQDSLQDIVKDVSLQDDSGKTKECMVWYNEEEKQKNNGLSIAKSYHDDLYKKRWRQVLTLLEIIPGVKVQSYVDTKKKSVLQSVIVENDSWKDFLDDFEENCIRTIRYINDQSNQILRWSDAVLSLGFENIGFLYFDNILRYLNGMAYIASDALLPTGIEIYTTDKSNNTINENIDETSDDYENKKAFDEALEIRNLRLCIMDILTSKIKNRKDFQDLISSYFSTVDASGFISILNNYYEESNPIWEAIRSTAIKNAEEQLKDNPEQWNIYNENSNININVEAGPGSGKTHLLTLKCAKLIYHQHVNPHSILVLAYNRAVVVELKSRLAKLFASLGLSRSASQLYVYTFHSLSKLVCGDKALEGRDMKDWEKLLLREIKDHPNEVRAVLPQLQYVFIDEFQDITQTRLNAMFALKQIYEPLTFFTIGDKDQSIYGFEKEESMDPNFYYNQLYEKLNPKKMTMSINYRSYPKILSAASSYLPKTSNIPVPCRRSQENEPKNEYVYIYDHQREWSQDFGNYIQWLREQGICDIAVFFRTNNEVYHGYSLVKSLNISGIRIRVQGASACELYRMREIYAVLRLLEKYGNIRIKLENQETELELKRKIATWIQRYPNWDTFYMDLAYVLILDYLDFAASDEDSHTYAEMAASIRETLKEDNPQLYKLYDDKRFANRRICTENQMNVILTTMHKVKGLEFDAVMITPSVTSLPFDPTQDIDVNEPLSEKDIEQIEEERRLLYVAYTRAKKFLFVYKDDRETAVQNMTRFKSLEDKWGIRERSVGLDNYNIGFNASYNFKNNKSIIYDVRKNDPVRVCRYRGKTRTGEQFSTYNILHNNEVIGQLSRTSTIAKSMEISDIDYLDGFFVSDVFYWTYEDTIAADQRALKEKGYNPDYASKWNAEAKNQGYVFIVNILGYGNKNSAI